MDKPEYIARFERMEGMLLRAQELRTESREEFKTSSHGIRPAK
jgi:hypothetical protein